MAVQVQVKGQSNGVDFSLLGHDARIERVHLDKEVVVITDVDNITLYMVPLSNVRLMVPIDNPQQEIPRSFGRNAGLKVHIAGDSEGDFEQVCNRIEYTKRYDTMMAELLNVTFKEGEEPDSKLLVALPFENIRYIDFNFYIETNESTREPDNSTSQGQPQGGGQQRPNTGSNKSGRMNPNRKNTGKRGSNKTKSRPNIKSKARK